MTDDRARSPVDHKIALAQFKVYKRGDEWVSDYDGDEEVAVNRPSEPIFLTATDVLLQRALDRHPEKFKGLCFYIAAVEFIT